MESSKPTFSLVYLTWNSENIIGRSLDAALDQEYNSFEVVVVDNNSQDDTINIIEDDYKEVRLFKNDTNLGYTRGTNKGIEKAKGEYICCYNDDTILPPDYLSSIDQYLTDDAVWTTARYNHRVTEDSQCIRLIGRQRFPIPYDVTGLEGVVEVNYVPGDGLIVPQRIIRDVLSGTLLDSELGFRGDDFELSLRLFRSDVPMRAILDTASTHPDKGVYTPTICNLFQLVENARTRHRAYRKNGGSIVDSTMVFLSIVTLPITVYSGDFPRSRAEFERKTKNRDNLLEY